MRFLSLSSCFGLQKQSKHYYVNAGDINPSTGKAYAVNPSSGNWDDNYFASTYGGSSGGSGQSRLDFTKGLVDSYTKTDADLAGKQSTARQNLMNYYSGLPSNVDLFNNFNKTQGVTDQQALVDSLTHSVLNTTSQLNAIPDSVKTRSGDFLINDADKTAIINHESAPVQKALASLISGKQDAEVGLAAKQQLVQTLLGLTQQDQATKAKPLELGVDYTTADRDAARSLFNDTAGLETNAYSADKSAEEAAAEAALSRAFESQQNDLNRSFQSSQADKTAQNQINLENISSKNQLSNSLALAQFDVNHRVGSTAGNGAPNDNPIYTGKTSQQVKQIESKTQDAWNSIVGGAKTEYDVWKAINDNQSKLAQQGVDVNSLWSNHAALAAKVGKGGDVRKATNGVDLNF